ncbi:hypothetical protein AB205_0154470 [Aquarana catesbeiana]|uniref:Uncharacterized protein n=1 Tax=Aquarana catesbeiana TaxID=8400 RepID=A0A2G9RTR1_AQUCT|nr:hypothetical protein AB205_0154470 [Aquarana catesbeiana]
MYNQSCYTPGFSWFTEVTRAMPCSKCDVTVLDYNRCLFFFFCAPLGRFPFTSCPTAKTGSERKSLQSEGDPWLSPELVTPLENFPSIPVLLVQPSVILSSKRTLILPEQPISQGRDKGRAGGNAALGTAEQVGKEWTQGSKPILRQALTVWVPFCILARGATTISIHLFMHCGNDRRLIDMDIVLFTPLFENNWLWQ